MKIKRIRIENLLSYEEFELEFPDFAVIVGPNNVGKTNIVRVLEFVRNLFGDKSVGVEELDGMLHGPKNREARVEIFLELNDDEIGYIRKFILCSSAPEVEKAKKGKIRFHVSKPNSNLEKTLENKEIQGKLNILFLQELEQSSKIIPELFRRVKVVWTYKGEATWLPKPVFEGNNFYLDYDGYIRPHHSGKELNEWSLLEAMELTFVEYLITYVGDKNTYPEETLIKTFQKAESDSWDWKDFTLKHFTYIWEEARFAVYLDIRYDFLPEEHKFEAKEFYKKFGWELREGRHLWDLLGGIFTSSVIQLGEIRGLPSEKEYKPIKEYDGKGENLTSFLHCLKELSDPRLEEEIKKHFKRFFSLDIDTVRDPSVEKAPRLVIKKGERRFPINAVGSGVFEILNLISTIAGSRGKVIILDEPALHLHPLYQKKVLQTLKDLKNQNQIILITHSPYLVDSEVLGNTYRFYMDRHRHTTRAVKVAKLLNTSDTKTITKIIKDPSFIRALFASGVIIVEGDSEYLSEYLSVPILLKKLGYPLEDYNIEIINAGSDTNIKSCIEIVEKLHIPFRVAGDKKAEDKIPSQYHNKALLCPADDWKDYLECLFGKGGGGKIDAVWNIVNRITKEDIEEKMSDFKEFIEEFINELNISGVSSTKTSYENGR